MRLEIITSEKKALLAAYVCKKCFNTLYLKREECCLNFIVNYQKNTTFKFR